MDELQIKLDMSEEQFIDIYGFNMLFFYIVIFEALIHVY